MYTHTHTHTHTHTTDKPKFQIMTVQLVAHPQLIDFCIRICIICIHTHAHTHTHRRAKISDYDSSISGAPTADGFLFSISQYARGLYLLFIVLFVYSFLLFFFSISFNAAHGFLFSISHYARIFYLSSYLPIHFFFFSSLFCKRAL